MKENFKLLFIGDIVGRPGRNIIKKFLLDDNNKAKYDFIIANVENASHGFGLTKKNHDELIEYGVDCMTSGNHIWDKKDIYSYINESEVLIRPYNYHKSTPGVGYRIFNNDLIVINMLGKTFMSPVDCPFVSLENIMNELKQNIELENKKIFIDFHAEATAEKQCFARYAFELGADEQLIEGKCAYLSDVGFCGSKNGIIGMEYENSLKRLITSINERFEVEVKPPFIFNACEIEFSSKYATSINRISFEYDDEEYRSED